MCRWWDVTDAGVQTRLQVPSPVLDGKACIITKEKWVTTEPLTHTGWFLSEPLLLFSASAASAAAFFSSNSSLLRTGPLRPSSTRLRANFLLYKTEERERVWSRRGDEACREGRAQHGRRAANVAFCSDVFADNVADLCPHAATLTLFQWPCRDSQLHDSPFENHHSCVWALGSSPEDQICQISWWPHVLLPRLGEAQPASAPQRKSYILLQLWCGSPEIHLSPKTAPKYLCLPHQQEEKPLKPASPSSFHWLKQSLN